MGVGRPFTHRGIAPAPPIPHTGPSRATDVSNWTGPLGARALAQWQAVGIDLVVVQAIDPPPGYPPGVTRQQLMACRDAGLTTDAYVYLWPGDTEASLMARARLAEGLPVRRWWLDVEQTGVLPEAVGLGLRVLDTCPASISEAGIYTGRWFWDGYLGGTDAFKDRSLWTSEYDGIVDPTRVRLYGGWTVDQVALKQYAGTSTLAGVGNVDLNVLSTSEAARL
jgi:Glycosyl hydrolases family 25